MAYGATTSLQQASLHGKAGIVEIKKGHDLPNARSVEKLGINTMDAHSVTPTGKGVSLAIGMVEIENASLANHGIVVEVLLESLPKLHRLLIELDVAGQEIV